MADRAEVTNQQIANDLGITNAGISRIRSGGRIPSLELMLKIERLTRWKLSSQATAKQDGTYAAKLEVALQRHYIEQAAETDTFVPAPAPYAG
jgi:transcriptional regulator with XRE-family HTH domain